MQKKGFLASLFDYSFSSFITPRLMKVLYVLATIMIALWTVLLILGGFSVSGGVGAVMLLVVGPLFFLFSMIWARVWLELIVAFFRINSNVQEIRDGRSGDVTQPTPTPATLADAPMVARAEAPALVADTSETASSAKDDERPADAGADAPATTTPPEGWYDDSERPGHKRWWDGTAWGMRDDEHPSAR